MAELWQWPYEPELDKWGVARAAIPENLRSAVNRGYRVHLMCPDGTVLKGNVISCNDHYARVRVEGKYV